jgi:hypothetical protein
MRYQQEVHVIQDVAFFCNYIKKEATFMFLECFKNSKEFIEKFEDNLLDDKIILVELKTIHI